MKPFHILRYFTLLSISLAPITSAEAVNNTSAGWQTTWNVNGVGAWTSSTLWNSGGTSSAACIPNALATARITGTVASGTNNCRVRIYTGTDAVTGSLEVGTGSNDFNIVQIYGGTLNVRKGSLTIGEAAGGYGAVYLYNDGTDPATGGLYCAQDVTIYGRKAAGVTDARGDVNIYGGGFEARNVDMGIGFDGGTQIFRIYGSAPQFVHIFEGLLTGRMSGTSNSSTLAFCLDGQGVTPITVGESFRFYPTTKLSVTLLADPPNAVVPLIAYKGRSSGTSRGTFDGRSEGATITATSPTSGNTYKWNLRYSGTHTGANSEVWSTIYLSPLASTGGFSGSTSQTPVRSIPATPPVLWTSTTINLNDVNPLQPPSPPAFPGAAGFGAGASGGRGGSVFVVTTTDDYDPDLAKTNPSLVIPGSLRQGIDSVGTRTIVFNVSGAINLKKPLAIRRANITIAGQSAPGPGITLYNYGINLQASNVILRYLRIRPGEGTDPNEVDSAGKSLYPHNQDALSIGNSTPISGIVVDHCSVSWGTDESLSITSECDLVTVQWTFITETLNFRDHSFGSIAGGERVTWHHNLWAHNISRNPRFATPTSLIDFRNNVIYDWGYFAGYGPYENLNYVNNYLKLGHSTTQDPPLFHKDTFVIPGTTYLGFVTGSGTGSIVTGNIVKWPPTYNVDQQPPTPYPSNPDWITNNNLLGVGWEPAADRSQILHTEFPTTPANIAVPTQLASACYDDVLASGGAILPARDTVDSRIVDEVQGVYSGTIGGGTRLAGRIIDTVKSGTATGELAPGVAEPSPHRFPYTTLGGYPVISGTSRPPGYDTDNDGMPDAWETSYFTNLSHTGKTDSDGDGYTDLEEFLNGTDPLNAASP